LVARAKLGKQRESEKRDSEKELALFIAFLIAMLVMAWAMRRAS
jgi:hypothetical protein